MIFQNLKLILFARNFFLALLFFNLIFFLSSCSTVNPVISDICQITDDICFYATSICDIYNSDSTKFENSKAVYALLVSDLERLKQIKNQIDHTTNKFLKTNQEDITKELIYIREHLKGLLPAE